MNFPIIRLASKSPRRQELLDMIKINFSLIESNFEESFDYDMPNEKLVKYLAYQKANHACPNEESDIILSADTVVLFEDRILGKPKDENEAINVLTALSGKWHKVLTAICLKSAAKTVIDTCYTEVKFDNLSSHEILYYIDQYKPLDKAGSYGIQDWIGHAKIQKINGSYSNVMGLPVHLVYQHLKIWAD